MHTQTLHTNVIRRSLTRSLTLATSLTLAAMLSGTGVAVAASMSSQPEQPSIDSVTTEQMQAAALSAQHQNGITFVTGGIGVDERAWLAAHAKDYNTQAEFARVPKGEYLADVKVTLKDAQGNTLLQTQTDGPMLYLQLKPGKYELVAAVDGQKNKRHFTVPRSGSRHLVIGFRPGLSE